VSEIKENSSITSNAGTCNRSFPGDDDEDVLPYPVPVLRKKKTATKQKYFLLTSKEARESKMKEVQDKKAREESKKARELV